MKKNIFSVITLLRFSLSFYLFFVVFLYSKNTFSQESTKKNTQNIAQNIIQNTMLEGNFLFEIEDKNQIFPFIIAFENQEKNAFVRNGSEKLAFDRTEKRGADSLHLYMDIFESVVFIKKIDQENLIFQWERSHNKNDVKISRTITYKAKKIKNLDKFSLPKVAKNAQIGGRWDVQFIDDKGKASDAVGEFTQKGTQIEGSFLTPTGDYRYISGEISGNSFALSSFGVYSAVLVKGNIQNDSLHAEFFGARGGKRIIKAKRNPNAKLPDASKLTYMKEGFDKIDFNFPNLAGEKISFSDKKFEKKVKIIQLMGSWCSNCLDESTYLANWYKKNQKRGIEIIGLCYERSPAFEQASQRVQKLQKRLQIPYTLLIAGVNEKQSASETLPMLNGVSAYPTTIFIDKQDKVRYIHTGFSGPATGIHYEEWQREFNALVDKLVKE